MADYGPQITACKLYKKTSAKGAVYFTGRMGNLKVAVLKSKDVADDGSEIWSIVYSQAPERPRDQSASLSSYASPQSAPARPEPKTYDAKVLPDDLIPF